MTPGDVERIRRRMAESEPSSEWPLTWADLDALLTLAEGLHHQGTTEGEVTVFGQASTIAVIPGGRVLAPIPLVEEARRLHGLLVASDNIGATLGTGEYAAFEAALRQAESEDQEIRSRVRTLLDGANESLRHAGNAAHMGKDLRVVAHWVRTLREAATLADKELAIYGS